MECDVETLKAFLVTAGCPSEAAAGLVPDVPLGEQGVSPGRRAALAYIATEALGAPDAPAMLLETGSLDDWSRFLGEAVDDATIKAAAVARIKAAAMAIPLARSYVLDRMRHEDAPWVARLFHAIYDANYPVVDYYVPEKLVALNRGNDVLTVVARLASGEIAGIGAFYRSSPPNPAVYEQGQLLVTPEYRQGSMAFRLLNYLDELSHAMTWAEAFFGEAVCNHLVTQKSGEKQGYTPCGIELGLMPSGAYAKEGAHGRVSCMMAMRVDRDRPLPLFLPECLRPVLEHILSGFSLRRDIRFAASDVPEAAETALTSRHFDFAQVERVQVATIGRDFCRHVDELGDRARRLGLAVVQVYLHAKAPGVAFAVDALQRRGYVFGAFAPLWFDGDALMLQWFAAPPDFAAINLLTDRSKTILAHIRDEWERRASR